MLQMIETDAAIVFVDDDDDDMMMMNLEVADRRNVADMCSK